MSEEVVTLFSTQSISDEKGVVFYINSAGNLMSLEIDPAILGEFKVYADNKLIGTSNKGRFNPSMLNDDGLKVVEAAKVYSAITAGLRLLGVVDLGIPLSAMKNFYIQFDSDTKLVGYLYNMLVQTKNILLVRNGVKVMRFTC